MATGRIGVTPTLGVRWSKAPTGGTTSLSGLDDNSVSLVYSVGYEQVYRNGTLLSRGNDYTATNGTTITLVDATLTGDIIEVFANELIPLTDAISKGQYNAKGALLSATAASTPGVLTVGSNDQVLTADSTTSTGLKWATPAAGGMTLLSTTTLSGAATTISSISGAYTNLYGIIYGATNATANGVLQMSINAAASMNYYRVDDGKTLTSTTNDNINFNSTSNVTRTETNTVYTFLINNYANTSISRKPFQYFSYYEESTPRINQGWGAYRNSIAVTEISLFNSGGTFSSGTVLLYGVK
jgi:hypothetical protein